MNTCSFWEFARAATVADPLFWEANLTRQFSRGSLGLPARAVLKLASRALFCSMTVRSFLSSVEGREFGITPADNKDFTVCDKFPIWAATLFLWMCSWYFQQSTPDGPSFLLRGMIVVVSSGLPSEFRFGGLVRSNAFSLHRWCVIVWSYWLAPSNKHLVVLVLPATLLSRPARWSSSGCH